MNQQYLFYVSYYNRIITNTGNATESLESLNKRIIRTAYYTSSKMPFSENGREDLIGWKTHCFPMKVCYPGLLAGLGYQHEAGDFFPDKDQEVKLGFSLDYVSGLPYIPGSTLKGVLRSAFKKYDTDIGHLLDVDREVVHALENAVFEEGDDIFLDVFPVAGDSHSRILGLEYITSHKADDPAYDGLTKINPLRLLKIQPEVKILVRFLLKDTVVTVGEHCIELKADVKKELFAIILERYGLGAKTNTGYGHVVRCEDGEDKKGFFWLLQDAGR